MNGRLSRNPEVTVGVRVAVEVCVGVGVVVGVGVAVGVGVGVAVGVAVAVQVPVAVMVTSCASSMSFSGAAREMMSPYRHIPTRITIKIIIYFPISVLQSCLEIYARSAAAIPPICITQVYKYLLANGSDFCPLLSSENFVLLCRRVLM